LSAGRTRSTQVVRFRGYFGAAARNNDLGSDPFDVEDLWRGGAVALPRNITPAAEANIWVDPEAASIVFNSGIPITVVGLDVCHQTLLRLDQLEAIDDATELGAFAKGATRPWFQKAADFGIRGGMHLYDTPAVAVSFRPDLVRTEPAWVAVETQGKFTYGQTVAYLMPLHKLWVGDKTHADVCLDLVDGPGFARLFAERVLARPLPGVAGGDGQRRMRMASIAVRERRASGTPHKTGHPERGARCARSPRPPAMRGPQARVRSRIPARVLPDRSSVGSCLPRQRRFAPPVTSSAAPVTNSAAGELR
jgi:hypothetical protein